MSDVICIGPVSVDLYSQQVGVSLEDASTFKKFVGGSTANVAIGLARLGLKTAVATRVGDESMGRYLLNTLQSEGIDTSLIAFDQERQTAISIRGVIPPDYFPTLEYRENSSDCAMNVSDLKEETFKGAEAILLSGSLCSSSILERVLDLAGDAKLIVDIDFHPVMWKKTQKINDLFAKSDLIIGTEKELMIASGQSNPGSALVSIRGKSNAVIIQKRGKDGCIIYPKGLDKPVIIDPLQANTKHSIGSGDAFLSGFLKGYIEEKKIEECAHLGNASGALVVSREGLSQAMPYLEELEYFVKKPHDYEHADHLHRVLKRPKDERVHCFLAVDHKSYFDEHHTSDTEITHFKSLVYEGVKRANKSFQDFRFGFVADAKSVLMQALNDENLLAIQCIEEPGAHPLAFLNDEEASKILQGWPRQVAVNVLVIMCQDENDRNIQVKRLHDLSRAAEDTGHELVVKLTYNESRSSLESICSFMESCYIANVFPTWWSIPAIEDEPSWKKIESLIREHDPYCLGVLLMNYYCHPEEVETLFSKLTTRYSIVKGFHVGRTIWGKAASQWLHGEVNDDEVSLLVEKQLAELIENCYLAKI